MSCLEEKKEKNIRHYLTFLDKNRTKTQKQRKVKNQQRYTDLIKKK